MESAAAGRPPNCGRSVEGKSSARKRYSNNQSGSGGHGGDRKPAKAGTSRCQAHHGAPSWSSWRLEALHASLQAVRQGEESAVDGERGEGRGERRGEGTISFPENAT